MQCEILTGSPPYGGSDRLSLLEQARKVHLAPAFARLDSSGQPAELVALTKTCLEQEPNKRPQSAAAVAKAVEGYLEGVQEARVRAERRAKRLTTGFAFLAILVLAAAGGLWYKLDRDNQRAEAQTRQQEEKRQQEGRAKDVNSAIDEMIDALNKDRFAEARACVERAKRLGLTARS